MTQPLLPTFRPGDRLTAPILNEVLDALSPGLNFRVPGGHWSGVGMSVSEPQADSFWARVTAVDSQGRYTWYEVQEDQTTDPVTFAQKPDGLYGSPDLTIGNPLYEANGSPIPLGSVVRTWKGDNDYYWATYSNRANFARVTGSLSGGQYPAVLTYYHAMTASWVDGPVISLRPANVETLVVGDRYMALASADDVTTWLTADPDDADTVTFVTNTCVTKNGLGYVTDISVEYTIFQTSDWSVVSKYCVSDPTGCCAEASGSCFTCCPGVSLANTLTAVVTDLSACSCLAGTYTLTQTSCGVYSMTATTPCGGGTDGTFHIFFECLQGQTPALSVTLQGTDPWSVTLLSSDCTQPCFVFDATIGASAGVTCSGSPTIQVAVGTCASGSIVGSTGGGGGTKTTICCPDNPTPQTIHLTISGSTCPNLNGTFVLVYDSVRDEWDSATLTCGQFWSLHCFFDADAGTNVWELGLQESGFGVIVPLTCSPFGGTGSFSYDSNGVGCCPAGPVSFNWSFSP